MNSQHRPRYLHTCSDMSLLSHTNYLTSQTFIYLTHHTFIHSKNLISTLMVKIYDLSSLRYFRGLRFGRLVSNCGFTHSWKNAEKFQWGNTHSTYIRHLIKRLHKYISQNHVKLSWITWSAAIPLIRQRKTGNWPSAPVRHRVRLGKNKPALDKVQSEVAQTNRSSQYIK